MALDKVTQKSSDLEYIAGSYRWGKMFKPPAPAKGTRHIKGFEEDNKMPDIEKKRSEYKMLSWVMEPGDCLVHHGLTMHGAGGNTTTNLLPEFNFAFVK